MTGQKDIRTNTTKRLYNSKQQSNIPQRLSVLCSTSSISQLAHIGRETAALLTVLQNDLLVKFYKCCEAFVICLDHYQMLQVYCWKCRSVNIWRKYEVVKLGVSVFQDYFLHNVALNKPSYQVSTYTDQLGSQNASLANDGNVNTCARSLSATNPWWAVDLGVESLVAQVNLINSGYNAGRDILFALYCFVNLVCIVLAYDHMLHHTGQFFSNHDIVSSFTIISIVMSYR